MKRVSVLAVLVLSLLACGGGNALVGEWEQVHPDTGVALGPVLTLSDDNSWSQNGTPSYEGTYKWESGSLSLHVEKLNGVSREESIAGAIAAGQPREDAEKGLDELDGHMKYELTSEDGAALLKQLDPPGTSNQKVFKKRSVD